MTCWTLLDFRPTGNDNEKMIRDIEGYRRELDANKLPSDRFLKLYVHSINVGENVGTTDRDETSRIADAVNDDKLPPSYYDDSSTRETANLCRAIRWLAIDTAAAEDDVGLIDIDRTILDVHKILLIDVESDVRKLGRFCTNDRETTYRGRVHRYPKYDTEDEARRAVQIVIDRYNALLCGIKSQPVDFALNIIKLAAWLLVNLVSLHPFHDGNGRVCRLLCDYCLSLVNPFHTPLIYDHQQSTTSDYVDAIVSYRTSGQPRDMAALLVRSSWLAWKAIDDQLFDAR